MDTSFSFSNIHIRIHAKDMVCPFEEFVNKLSILNIPNKRIGGEGSEQFIEIDFSQRTMNRFPSASTVKFDNHFKETFMLLIKENTHCVGIRFEVERL